MDGQNTGGDMMQIFLYFVGIATGYAVGTIAAILSEKVSAFCAKHRKIKKSKKSTWQIACYML